MTPSEALKVWLPVIAMGVENMPECKEALEMAIKALEAVENTDRLAEWLKNCRDATPEERESVDKYVESISTPTGVTFDGDRAVSLDAVLNTIRMTKHFYEDPLDYNYVVKILGEFLRANLLQAR